MRASYIIVSAIAAFSLATLALPQNARAAECPNFEEWTEYRCASVDTCRAESPGQNNNTLSRNCWIPGINEVVPEKICETNLVTKKQDCKDVPRPTCVRGQATCGPPALFQDCGISRVCSGQTGWTKIAAPPTDWCACAGKCYIPPNIKSLGDPSLSPRNALGEDGKVKLPVNVGWDETAERQIVVKDSCAIGAYRYEIADKAGSRVTEKAIINPRISCDPKLAKDDATSCEAVFGQAYQNEDGGMMNKAHAIADKNRGNVSTPGGNGIMEKGVVSPTYNYLTRLYDYVLSEASDALNTLVRGPERFCILTPGQAYALKIKPCIDQAGNDCGKESAAISFSTYQAPELIFPFDRDFEGSSHSNPQIPTVLQWCKDPLAESYSINLTRKTTPEELKETGLNEIQIPLDNITKDQTSYVDETALREIKNRVLYYWQIVSCALRNGQQCLRPSQQWSIFAQDVLGVPETLASDPVVNAESVLTWYESLYTPLYFVHITGGGKDVYKATKTRSLAIDTVWDSLQTNTQYSWRVTACPLEATAPSQCNKDNKDKSGKIGWSAFASFATTGAPPIIELSPSKNETATLPLDIRWNRVPGALSYAYTLKGEQEVKGFTTDVALNAALASSQDPGTFRLNTEKTYILSVASCASKNGTRCGAPATQLFTVKPPQKPEPLSPAPSTTVSLPDVRLEWKPTFSGDIYQHSITYL
ncbi:MAG: hypothetical protein HYW98_00530, partial [Candidatus Wildermuthbacteria bacterium]|nr:hypothetical protein [Candidatus Wildermuthbacteria bacterium]